VRTINNDGNVLFPCTSNGIILDLVEDLDGILSVKGLSGHVRMFVVSPMAEEFLKYMVSVKSLVGCHSLYLRNF